MQTACSAIPSKPLTDLKLAKLFTRPWRFLGLTHLAECSVVGLVSIQTSRPKRNLNHWSITWRQGGCHTSFLRKLLSMQAEGYKACGC